MKNKPKETSYFDEQLKQLDKDIIWKEKRKSKLENEILVSMDRDWYKTKLFVGFKSVSNIGILVILLLVGYYFLSNSLIHQSGGSSTGNQGNQTSNDLLIGDKNSDEEVEKEAPKNDENYVDSEGVVEDKETNMEIHTGSSETIIRKVEGMDLEVNVINYHMKTYGIAYRLDEAFGVPEVNNNQISYSANDDYKITLEMIEHTNLEKAVSNLQERFDTEGYEESYELESTHVEENGLMGKIQFYGDHPMKGFIAYEIDEHALVITFQYPIEGADAMNPLLETLRRSIHVQ